MSEVACRHGGFHHGAEPHSVCRVRRRTRGGGKPMNRLEGKVALVTGAGSGVGRATAELFSYEGASVVLVGRTESSLSETRSLLADHRRSEVVVGDLSLDGVAHNAVQEAIRVYGRLDILIHAAGVGYSWEKQSPNSMNAIAETSLEKWNEVVSINLNACYLVCRASIIAMRASGGGSIVNVASAGGLRGMLNAHAYSAAKAGVINLTRSLCVTYASDRIRANVVAPGPIDTPMLEPLAPLFHDRAQAERITPMGRAGMPAEVAYGCLYLASDEASYCNGSVLTIDGGLTAR